MLPQNWRTAPAANKSESQISDNGVTYLNGIIYSKGGSKYTVKLPPHMLDSLELFPLDRKHKAYSNKHSKGVRAKCDIPKDSIIGCYAGVFMPGCFSSGNPYIFLVGRDNQDVIIDALLFGNITRYINDPKDMKLKPNLYARPIMLTHKKLRLRTVEFVTLRKIKAGEELLYNYEDGGTKYWDTYGIKPTIIDLLSDDINSTNELELVSKAEIEAPEPIQKKHKKQEIFLLGVKSKNNLKVLEVQTDKGQLFECFVIRTFSKWNIKVLIPDELAKKLTNDASFGWYSSANNKDFTLIDLKDFTIHSNEEGRKYVVTESKQYNLCRPFPCTSFGTHKQSLPVLFKFQIKCGNCVAETKPIILVSTKATVFTVEQDDWGYDYHERTMKAFTKLYD